jgi:hypothetical protein
MDIYIITIPYNDIECPNSDIDLESDSIYSSPALGAGGSHCVKCGAPVIGITDRYCVNPNCENSL